MNNTDLFDIYTNIIRKEADTILTENCGLFFLNDAYNVFSFEYKALHEYYSKKYMNPNSNGLDTHKEISTIVIALLKSKLIKTVDAAYYDCPGNSRFAFNERLAFRSGCGILKSCMVEDINTNNKMSDDEKAFCIKKLEEKLCLPKTSYQSYEQNVITEFYYTSREGSYNILGLADKFFWIERFNKKLIRTQYLKSKNTP